MDLQSFVPLLGLKNGDFDILMIITFKEKLEYLITL